MVFLQTTEVDFAKFYLHFLTFHCSLLMYLVLHASSRQAFLSTSDYPAQSEAKLPLPSIQATKKASARQRTQKL